MDPMQAYILQSAMNQRGGQGLDMNTMGLPPGMNVPPPAGAPIAPNIPGPSSAYKPMPMPQQKQQMQGPKPLPNLGEAAQQVMQRNQQQDSPIFRGIQSAMDAGRESYNLSDEQKRRAEGEAIMAFFGNMANSDSRSTLGAINQSFMPALNQYNAAEARGMGLNKEVLDRIASQQREERLEKATLQKLKGGMTANKALDTELKYNNAQEKYDNSYNKRVRDWFSSLPEESQTPEALEIIKMEVEKQLRPQKRNIDRLRKALLNNGISAGAYDDSEQDYGSDVDFTGGSMLGESSMAADGTNMSELSDEDLLALASGGM